MSKILVLGLVGVYLSSVALAKEEGLGIGVTPAEIEITGQVDWPYTVPLTVTNFSSQEEQFEVFGAQARPGKFSLDAGESRRVLLTFEEPAEGVVKVLSMKNSAEGLNTGTGVKIPFRIVGAGDATLLVGAIEVQRVFSYLLGVGMVLATLFLLWHIAGQTIKIFGVLFGVLVFGVLLGVSLANIGYVPVSPGGTIGVAAEQKEITVDLVVDYGSGDTQAFPDQTLRTGDSVLSLLEQGGVALEKRNFPGMGVFIEAINGVHNSNNYYWQFWVNGEYATVGAGQYELKHGDEVLWKRTNELPNR